jgi:hypothetical protein
MPVADFGGRRLPESNRVLRGGVGDEQDCQNVEDEHQHQVGFGF